MRPNIVLVVLDTARADAFEPYGAPAGSSPTVADLAARGAAFNVSSPANWTVPAHASMFTGLLPRELGLTQVAGGDRARCRQPLQDARERHLVQWLQQAGWQTRGVSANPWISADSGFDLGFDEFVLAAGRGRPAMTDRSPVGHAAWLWAAARARADHGARQVSAVLGRWMHDRAPGRPFFWFVNLLECHSPYLPPRPHSRLSTWQRVLAAEEARRYLTLDSMFRACAGNLTVPSGALERMRAQYDGAVRLCDDWLAQLLDDLDGARMLDDTQVIVTSDHGENFGDDGLIGHAFSLDERLLRVPFVTAGPMSLGGDLGTAPVSLADLPSLLAEGLGLTDPPWRRAGGGVVVAQHDGVAPADSDELRQARLDWGLDDHGVRVLSRSLTTASDGRWKLLRDGAEVAAYDLATDPREQRQLPLDAVPPAARQLLVAELDRATEGVGPAPVVQSPPDTAVDDLEERMRMLGYL